MLWSMKKRFCIHSPLGIFEKKRILLAFEYFEVPNKVIYPKYYACLLSSARLGFLVESFCKKCCFFPMKILLKIPLNIALIVLPWQPNWSKTSQSIKFLWVFILKYSSDEIIPSSCKCSIFLGLTFVEKTLFVEKTWYQSLLYSIYFLWIFCFKHEKCSNYCNKTKTLFSSKIKFTWASNTVK